jgi:CRP-like cAMP-binding protein
MAFDADPGRAASGRDHVRDLWCLRRIHWLETLSSEEVERLRRSSTSREYQRGEMVFEPTAHPSSVYLLERGLIRIYRLSESGGEATLGFVGPGEVFGELAAFSDAPRESFAQAARASTAWRIPRAAFTEAIGAHPQAVLEVTKQVGTRLKRIESRMEDLIFRDVHARVARVLLELAQDFGRAESTGVRIDLPLTQTDLAMLVGSTRQTVNATLRRLTEEGLLGRDQRQFVIARPDALRAVIEHPAAR